MVLFESRNEMHWWFDLGKCDSWNKTQNLSEMLKIYGKIETKSNQLVGQHMFLSFVDFGLISLFIGFLATPNLDLPFFHLAITEFLVHFPYRVIIGILKNSKNE